MSIDGRLRNSVLADTVRGIVLQSRLSKGEPGTAIDDEWSAKAAAVETVDVPLEKSDIWVTARFLVWVPRG
jgi:hypothetical protein